MTDQPPILDDGPPEPPPAPENPPSEEGAAPVGAPPTTAPAETRWDIVGRQFRKHRPAVWGLRVTIGLILIAVYAPVIASGHPFVYTTPDGTTTFPWFSNLFDTRAWDQLIDRFFNLGMVVLTGYFLVKFAMKFFGVGAQAPIRRLWRRFAILAFVVIGILQATGTWGVTSNPTTVYRKPINDVKHAEDVVTLVPVAAAYRSEMQAAGASFGAMEVATRKMVETLNDLKSTAAAQVVPPVERASQALLAQRTKTEFAVRRIGRRFELPFGTASDVAKGSDATGPSEQLLASWTVLRKILKPAEGNEVQPDPHVIVREAVEALGGDGAPPSPQYGVALAQLDGQLQEFAEETSSRLLKGLDALELPTPEKAAEKLATAEEVRDSYTIIYPLIPYSYRDQLPQGYDRFNRSFNFERGERHLLGTDEEGRDVFSRLLYGTRISLTIGLVAVSIYITIGTILGALAGFFGGFVDLVIMRLVEIIICIPGLFLILTIVALFDQKSIFMIMFAIGIVSWTGITRLVRGEFLRERNSEYVLSAEAMGFSTPRIIFRHVLPNAVGPVLVSATFGVAGAILTESGLSFLGLGDPTAPSWGGILDHGRTNQYWHLIIPPSIAIFITVTALNLVGDGVRDALDPKLRD